MESLNLERFCAGNVFLFREVHTDKLTLVPVEEIERSFGIRSIRPWRMCVAHGPDGQNTISQWFPTSEYRRGVQRLRKPPNTAYEVNGNYVVCIPSSGRHADMHSVHLIPLAAALWSVAYSGYLRDSARLSKALSKIAWAIVNSNNQGKRQWPWRSRIEATWSVGDLRAEPTDRGRPERRSITGTASRWPRAGCGFGIGHRAVVVTGCDGQILRGCDDAGPPTINGFKLGSVWRDFFNGDDGR